MTMTTLEAQIAQITQSFVNGIFAAMRQASLEELASIGDTMQTPTPSTKRGPGRPKGSKSAGGKSLRARIADAPREDQSPTRVAAKLGTSVAYVSTVKSALKKRAMEKKTPATSNPPSVDVDKQPRAKKNGAKASDKKSGAKAPAKKKVVAKKNGAKKNGAKKNGAKASAKKVIAKKNGAKVSAKKVGAKKNDGSKGKNDGSKGDAKTA